MPWPLASHFSAMLQHPRLALRDARLHRYVIEKDENGQPRPWAGAFAVVFKGIYAETGETLAIRAFTTASPERRERYEEISAHLADRKLDCLVGFQYHDEGIRSASDGRWYPLITMDWAKGETLFGWLEARCQELDGAAVGSLAESWVEAMNELHYASVAHGDLQHANVIVTANHRVKLVDYDCLCVPSLVGRRNLEIGVEPYQHPQRDARTLLSLNLGNFSALLIYVAMRALAAEPELWNKHVDAAGYDKLLFRRVDFEDRENSRLYHDLTRSPDRAVGDLTRRLFACFHGPMDRVLPLNELLKPKVTASPCAGARQATLSEEPPPLCEAEQVAKSKGQVEATTQNSASSFLGRIRRALSRGHRWFLLANSSKLRSKCRNLSVRAGVALRNLYDWFVDPQSREFKPYSLRSGLIAGVLSALVVVFTGLKPLGIATAVKWAAVAFVVGCALGAIVKVFLLCLLGVAVVLIIARVILIIFQ